MRVRYIPISEREWMLHYQRGGFIGVPFQRGAGLGSIFRSLFRAILPIAKSAGRVVGKRALQAGAEIASDLVAGKELKSTLEERGRSAASDLLSSAAAKLKGGRKRKTTKRRSIKGATKRGKQTRTQIGVINGSFARQRK